MREEASRTLALAYTSKIGMTSISQSAWIFFSFSSVDRKRMDFMLFAIAKHNFVLFLFCRAVARVHRLLAVKGEDR